MQEFSCPSHEVSCTLTSEQSSLLHNCGVDAASVARWQSSLCGKDFSFSGSLLCNRNQMAWSFLCHSKYGSSNCSIWWPCCLRTCDVCFFSGKLLWYAIQIGAIEDLKELVGTTPSSEITWPMFTCKHSACLKALRSISTHDRASCRPLDLQANMGQHAGLGPCATPCFNPCLFTSPCWSDQSYQTTWRSRLFHNTLIEATTLISTISTSSNPCKELGVILYQLLHQRGLSRQETHKKAIQCDVRFQSNRQVSCRVNRFSQSGEIYLTLSRNAGCLRRYKSHDIHWEGRWWMMRHV